MITDALRHRPAKPVLGAVNGLAYGGGLEVLLPVTSSCAPTTPASRCPR